MQTISSAEGLPYPEDRLDFILMVTVDCFLEDVDQAYREAHRVLKEGGSIIISILDNNEAIAKEYGK